ncbi:hypothetical protein AGRA3207_001546 [Actinomadura graeca]|uniref:Uncharacterized protein n=1 Tax=Actinomadura graeca TaxID=2750812 RepID=A0ABX8QQ06_9ACTN|nr:hypothetical protein [Actinomadura graeca]QXJ20776.1 hypothetical protein AGRA3207_001546 [Actinomadura graeca]
MSSHRPQLSDVPSTDHMHRSQARLITARPDHLAAARTTFPAEARDPAELLSRETFDLLVEDLRRGHHVTRGYAERMLGQALVFLKAQANIARARAAGRPWVRIVPTVPVDPAWHAFMLRSQPYADFCAEHAGAFLHHVPFQDEAVLSGDALEATIPELQKTGYMVDLEFWHGERSPCCPPECASPESTW